METLECIRTRASVRSFRPEAVPEAVLGTILEAGTRAPSAGNTQDWVFIVVKEQEARKLLSEATTYGQAFVAAAPVVVVVCSDLGKIGKAYGQRGRDLYSIQDTAAAVQNMLLAAWDQGVGSCWVGAFDERRARECLGIPEGVRPVAILPLGYPAENPGRRGRLGLEEVCRQERY
jgi:nitroreductase